MFDNFERININFQYYCTRWIVRIIFLKLIFKNLHFISLKHLHFMQIIQLHFCINCTSISSKLLLDVQKFSIKFKKLFNTPVYYQRYAILQTILFTGLEKRILIMILSIIPGHIGKFFLVKIRLFCNYFWFSGLLKYYGTHNYFDIHNITYR